MESVACEEELDSSFTFLLDYLYYGDLVWTKEAAMACHLSDEMHIEYQRFPWLCFYYGLNYIDAWLYSDLLLFFPSK